MGFLLNADVVNGQYLTLIGVVVGFILGALNFIYRRRQSLKYMSLIFDVDKPPWYQKPPNYPMTFFFSILGGMVSVTLLNNIPDSGDRITEYYEVTKVDERRVRYDLIEY